MALDIDGTLGDYHGHFTRFAEQWMGREMPDPAENTHGVPLWQWLGMSKANYRKCKLAFRRGGLKRSMPAYKDADLVTRYIRKELRCSLWICTSRPYLALETIDEDTRHWLRRNGVQYDEVIWGEHKYRDLVRAVGRERVRLVVDDLPPMIAQAVGLGLSAAIRTQPYNLEFRHEPRVDQLTDIIDLLEDK